MKTNYTELDILKTGGLTGYYDAESMHTLPSK